MCTMMVIYTSTSRTKAHNHYQMIIELTTSYYLPNLMGDIDLVDESWRHYCRLQLPSLYISPPISASAFSPPPPPPPPNPTKALPLTRLMEPVSFEGAEISYPNIFSSACTKIKWFCQNISCFLARKWPLEHFGVGWGAGALSPLRSTHFLHRFSSAWISVDRKLSSWSSKSPQTADMT